MSRYNKTSWIKSFHWYECQFNLVQLSVLKRIPGPRFSSYNYSGSASCCLATVARPHTHWRYSTALQQCNCREQELYRILDIYWVRNVILSIFIVWYLYFTSWKPIVQFAGLSRVCAWPQPSAAVISHQHLNQDIRLTRNLFVTAQPRSVSSAE